MKKNLIIVFIFFIQSLFSQIPDRQIRVCGTNDNLEIFLKNNPIYKDSLKIIEDRIIIWADSSGRAIKENNSKASSLNKLKIKARKPVQFNSQTTEELELSYCDYNNQLYEIVSAPIALNQIITPNINCIYGGEFVRVNNLIAGKTYRISVSSEEDEDGFDTTINLFSENGSERVAYNDDFNESLNSEIYFTPFSSGSYDILIDEFGCQSNQLCSSLEIELIKDISPVISIPVVIHVIHNGEEIGIGSNISEDQINSQIDVLNQDFRRLNNEIQNTSPSFKGFSADTSIEFCLAKRDPDGNPTNGIKRFEIQTILNELISEGLPDDLQCLNVLTMELLKVYTIWDRNSYLNIWVSDSLWEKSNELPGCDIEGSTLGYAQFPGTGGPLSGPDPSNIDPAFTDGIWVLNSAFGTIGPNLLNQFNLGKTATHEVGHWLNLKHIWGEEKDNEDVCLKDDEVIDTPKQAISTAGCPNSLYIGDDCSEDFPGIMYNNFMDYSDDSCLSMFSYGQSVRMDATLNTIRSLLLNSMGCQPTNLNSQNFIIDNSIKVYPNPVNDFVYIEFENSENYIAEIYTLLGQKIIEMNLISEKKNRIDLSTLENGLYFLKLKSLDHQNINFTILKRG